MGSMYEVNVSKKPVLPQTGMRGNDDEIRNKKVYAQYLLNFSGLVI